MSAGVTVAMAEHQARMDAALRRVIFAPSQPQRHAPAHSDHPQLHSGTTALPPRSPQQHTAPRRAAESPDTSVTAATSPPPSQQQQAQRMRARSEIVNSVSRRSQLSAAAESDSGTGRDQVCGSLLAGDIDNIGAAVGMGGASAEYYYYDQDEDAAAAVSAAWDDEPAAAAAE